MPDPDASVESAGIAPPTNDTSVVLDQEDDGEGDLQASYDGELSIEKGDRSLSEFLRWYDDGDLIVDPEWQRNYVWSVRQASKLIESFLLNIPVPVIYLARTADNKFEVIDGLQRLTSAIRFLKNKLRLRHLTILDHLNGKQFRDLDSSDQRKLRNSIMRSFELSKHNSADMHFVVFERLNTGGTRLNEMEIRNCLFRGALNEKVKELARDRDFRQCVNETTLETRMKDRSLVLRFLAFYERTHFKCRKGMKKFLNEFMEVYRNPTEEKLREFEDKFRHCVKASLTVFGRHAFRLKSDITGSQRSLGEWSSRSNSAIFQCVATSFADYTMPTITKHSDQIYEEYLDLIHTDKQWVDFVRRATGTFERLDYVFETWQKRLRSLLRDDAPMEPRAFSKKLKEELFSQDATCGLCGNAISLIDDAVVDHDEHYWRGGKTVPENARLAHRYCNLARGGR